MTADELRKLFNYEFRFHQKWPTTFEVDHETYANVCQAVFNHQSDTEGMYLDTVENGEQKSNVKVISITIGKNKGIMFKDVELILKQEAKQ